MQQATAAYRVSEPGCGKLQGVGKVEMNAGDEPVIGITDSFSAPGIYTIEVSLSLLYSFPSILGRLEAPP